MKPAKPTYEITLGARNFQDKVSSLPGTIKVETVLLSRFPLMPYPKEHISDF